MELAELLRAEHPAIAAEARSRDLLQRYRQVRHIGGHRPDSGPNPAFVVFAPFVGTAVRSAQAYESAPGHPASRQDSRERAAITERT